MQNETELDHLERRLRTISKRIAITISLAIVVWLFWLAFSAISTLPN